MLACICSMPGCMYGIRWSGGSRSPLPDPCIAIPIWFMYMAFMSPYAGRPWWAPLALPAAVAACIIGLGAAWWPLLPFLLGSCSLIRLAHRHPRERRSGMRSARNVSGGAARRQDVCRHVQGMRRVVRAGTHVRRANRRCGLHGSGGAGRKGGMCDLAFLRGAQVQ